MVIKTKKGWQIKSHRTGKIYPKVYSSKSEAEKRVAQMRKWSKIKKN